MELKNSFLKTLENQKASKNLSWKNIYEDRISESNETNFVAKHVEVEL